MERQKTVLLYFTMVCTFSFALLENTGISISMPPILERLLTIGGFASALLLMNSKDAAGNYKNNPGVYLLVPFIGMVLLVMIPTLLEKIGISFEVTPVMEYIAAAFGFAIAFLLLGRKDTVKSLRKNPCLYVLLAFLGMVLFLTISSFVNEFTIPVYNPVTSNLMFVLFLAEAVCLVLYANATGKTAAVFNFWFYIMLGFVLLNDALLFSGAVYFTDGSFETYLVGSKFDVVYMHMNLMALYFARMKLLRPGIRNAKLPLPMLLTFLILNIVISLWVDCNTGMLGSLMLTVIIWYFDRHEKRCRSVLFSGRFFALICLVSVMFAYYVFWLIRQPLVIDIVVNKLGRSLTLTGRTEIYEMYPSVMSGHWLWGYGIGNGYPVCWPSFGYTDVQNAILQWVLLTGVPAVGLMLLFCGTIIAVCKRKNNIAVIMPIAALIYVYLLLGTVEITINRNFFMMMITMLLLAVSDQMPNKRLGISALPEKEQELKDGSGVQQ